MANKKHGCSIKSKRTKEYMTWDSMKQRCRNINHLSYKYYGARGITFCKEFEDFQVFLDHVGLAPSKEYSIDRIDNNRGYELGNVRWATKIEQENNHASS